MYQEAPKGDFFSNVERGVVAANPPAFDSYDFGPPKQMMKAGPRIPLTQQQLKARGFVGLYLRPNGG